MEQLILAVVLVIWVVAAWAMIRMLLAGLKAGERSLWRFLSGSVLLESYNRKNFLIFCTCVAIGIVVAIFFNVLFLISHIGT